MLEIKNLHADVHQTPILKGLSLSIQPGEVHAIMGPNGSGKSTLSKVLAGHPSYTVTQGEALYTVNLKQKNLFEMDASLRAREGLFLAFQYPVEIPGVSNLTFLHEAFNQICQHQGSPEMDLSAFKIFVEKKALELGMGGQFLDRSVNEGFSGGEKKRNEILQMAILNPRISFLDETDSGLDIDSLKIVADGVNKLRGSDKSFVLVTHYQRLLDYIKPDFVHVLYKGRIIKSGGPELALELEKRGYDWLIQGQIEEVTH